MLYILHVLSAVLDNGAPPFENFAVIVLYVIAYHVLPDLELVNLILPVLYSESLSIASLFTEYPTISYPSLVIVGDSTSHVRVSKLPLYALSVLQNLYVSPDNDAPFPLKYALNVFSFAYVIAYHVLFVFELFNVIVFFERSWAEFLVVDSLDILNPSTFGVDVGAVIIGADTLHETCLFHALHVTSLLKLKVLLFSEKLALYVTYVIAYNFISLVRFISSPTLYSTSFEFKSLFLE